MDDTGIPVLNQLLGVQETNFHEKAQKESDDLMARADAHAVKDKKQKKQAAWIFAGLSVAMAALGAISILGDVTGLEEFTYLTIAGLALLGGTTVYTLQQLQLNASDTLLDDCNKVHGKMIGLLEKKVQKKENFPTKIRRRRKVVGGVASAIAEAIGISPGYVRLALLAMIPMTGGIIIPLYFGAALLLGSDKPEERL